LSLLLLFILFNKIRDKGRKFLPGSEGVGGGRRERREEEGGDRNGPNIVCTYE
jgi:hypothetical protein